VLADFYFTIWRQWVISIHPRHFLFNGRRQGIFSFHRAETVISLAETLGHSRLLGLHMLVPDSWPQTPHPVLLLTLLLGLTGESGLEIESSPPDPGIACTLIYRDFK
jgi:hypothetical protein